MYYKIQDFLQDWKHQSETIQKNFEYLTDNSLSRQVYPEGRSLGFIAWHIVLSVGEFGGKLGVVVDCPPEDTEPPENAGEIADAFKKATTTLYNFIQKNWDDQKLLEENNLYGNVWKNGFTLNALISHQTHHHGQMTVLMRQAGLKVHGAFGPSKEEWAAMGMPSPK